MSGLCHIEFVVVDGGSSGVQSQFYVNTTYVRLRLGSVKLWLSWGCDNRTSK